MISIDSAGILDFLDHAPAADIDDLDFGVIRMEPPGTVRQYNRAESRRSGLSTKRVIGRDFFREVAPCTNNPIIAQRFRDEPELDALVDYVFTFRMRPTRVHLRLLRSMSSPWWYLLVHTP